MSGVELLAPAGQWECLIAAVQNGADAVYLGGKGLNARKGAGNFDAEELKRASDYLHERGKKLYVTVNTIVKQREFGELEQVARELAACHADAAIVQDFGVCEALGQMVPGLRLHASTQMAVCNRQGAEYLKKRGFERAVLAREMPLEEIRACSEAGIETEVFCHGALCVACSGQCLFSSMVGGRSGNRGMCAQPCRMEYSLSGAARVSGYLLSPKDLMTAPILGEIVSAGASSLKIEGRLKRPEYVAIVTRIYRKLLDGAPFTEKDEDELKQIFNRGGFTQGYLRGVSDGSFLSVKRPSHWGIRAGESKDSKTITLERDISAQDAAAIRPENGEDVPVHLNGSKGMRVQNPARLKGEVYLMSSASQLSDAKESYRVEKQMVRLSARLEARVGKALSLTLSDGKAVQSVSGEKVEQAQSKKADPARVREQLSKTGGTCYSIEDAVIDMDEDAFVPVSEINRLRREALEMLGKKRIELRSGATGSVREYDFPDALLAAREKPGLSVMGSDILTLRACLQEGADDAIYFPADLREEALEKADIRGLFIHLPAVCSGSDLEVLNRFCLKHSAEEKGVYLSNIGQMGLDWPGEKRFGFELNLCNTGALSFLNISDERYIPSVELTAAETSALGGNQELVVYGRLPLMHLRHCPLNAARGGELHAACRACDEAKEGKRLNDCFLTDRMKAVFPLRRTASDSGCIIDVLNSVPLELSGQLKRLPACKSYLILLSVESRDEAIIITRRYRRLADAGESEAANGKYTTGHYFRPIE